MSKKGDKKTYYPYHAFLGIDPNTLMMLSQIAGQQQSGGAPPVGQEDYGSYTPDPGSGGQQQKSVMGITKDDLPTTKNILKQTGKNLFAGLAGPLGFAASAGFGAWLNHVQQRSADDTQDYYGMKAYRKTATVDPAYMALGGIPGPLPVQAEDGEVIVMPDGTSLPVNAKKKHKQQDKSDVTDILPPDGFILSNDKRMIITRKQAEKMVIGSTPALYDEHGTGESPKEIKMSDLFKKGQNKATPADLMRNLEKMYPRTDREKDVFADAAVAENTLGRSPYLQGIIALNMLKKDEVIGSEQKAYEEQEGVPQAAEGMDYEELIKQYQEAQRKYGLAQVEGIEDNENAYKKYFKQANIANVIGTGVGAAFTAAQDSYVAAPQLQAPSLSEFKGLSQSQIESQLNRLGRNTRNVANSLQSSGASSGQIAAAAAGTTANIAEAQSNIMYQNNATNAALLRRYYETRRNTRNQQSMLDTKAINEQTANQNRQLGAIGNTISSGINTYVQNQANKTKILGDLNIAKKTAIARGDVEAAAAAMQLAALENANNKGNITNITNVNPPTTSTPPANVSPSQVPVNPPAYKPFNPSEGQLSPPSSFNLPPLSPAELPKGVGPSGRLDTPPPPEEVPAQAPQETPQETPEQQPSQPSFKLPSLPPVELPKGAGPSGRVDTPAQETPQEAPSQEVTPQEPNIGNKNNIAPQDADYQIIDNGDGTYRYNDNETTYSFNTKSQAEAYAKADRVAKGAVKMAIDEYGRAVGRELTRDEVSAIATFMVGTESDKEEIWKTNKGAAFIGYAMSTGRNQHIMDHTSWDASTDRGVLNIINYMGDVIYNHDASPAEKKAIEAFRKKGGFSKLSKKDQETLRNVAKRVDGYIKGVLSTSSSSYNQTTVD